MIMTCRCCSKTGAALARMLGMFNDEAPDNVEVEFKEVPWFLVSRSRKQWTPETQGNINEVRILSINERGLVVDPDSQPHGKDATQAMRHTLIPWTNIISLTLSRVPECSGGPEKV